MSDTEAKAPEGFRIGYVMWVHEKCNTMVLNPATHVCGR